MHTGTYHPHFHVSLSARRAWIEIVITAMTSQISVVALRKESVDRNGGLSNKAFCFLWSLSARRAWIEIGGSGDKAANFGVALRKESVDRNTSEKLYSDDGVVALRKESGDRNECVNGDGPRRSGRSPQGERG